MLEFFCPGGTHAVKIVVVEAGEQFGYNFGALPAWQGQRLTKDRVNRHEPTVPPWNTSVHSQRQPDGNVDVVGGPGFVHKRASR